MGYMQINDQSVDIIKSCNKFMDQSSSEPLRRHPQADAIYQIIQEAQKYEGSDFQKAIDLLDKAKKILPQLNEGKAGESSQTMANNTIENANLELTYRSKLANLYYNIHQYEKSLEIYQKLIEKIPANPKLQKAAGDSLRHLNRFDDAIRIYEEGVKICSIIKSFAEFEANILNSEGLTFIAQQKYDEATQKLERAIKIASKNPLYYCNLASAYHSKGDRTKALNNYEAAQKLLKEPLEEEGLTKDNVKFIDKTLSKFLQNLKKLHNIQEDDQTFNDRVNNYGTTLTKAMETGMNNSKEAQKNNPENEAKHLFEASKVLAMVKDPANKKLNQFYRGMKSTLTTSYQQADNVWGGQVTINTNNLATTVASNLAGFLPIIGSQLSSAINFVGNFISGAQIKKQAGNILKISDGPFEFDKLAQDTVLRLISNNKDLLLSVHPDDVILPAWAESFEGAAKWLKEKKQAFQQHLFGSRYDTDMERYGFRIGTDLIAKHVATGKLYGSDDAVDIVVDEMIKRLNSAAEDIFKADRSVQKQKVKQAKPEGKKEATEGRKCEIY